MRMEALVMADIQPAADRLVRLLENQLEHVSRLAELSTRQTDLIAAARSEPILALLADRQEVMDELAESQEDLGELSRETEELTDLSADQRKHMRDLIDAITKSLNGILRRDESDRDALAQLRDRARADLADFGTARAAHRAYAVGRPAGSRFADRQG